ncbi:MAG: hypothetical protein NW237_16265 [Cyanobacteriota bacterium]|nr:hypothetical protein [Cyanobacteriota bacterium]
MEIVDGDRKFSERMAAYLIANGSKFDFYGDDQSLLHVAVSCQQEQTVRQLLELGILANIRDYRGATPLHHFPKNLVLSPLNSTQYEAIVRSLVDAGADIHAHDNDGLTPLATLLQAMEVSYFTAEDKQSFGKMMDILKKYGATQ